MKVRRKYIVVGGLVLVALTATAVVRWYNPSLARGVAAIMKEIVPIEAPFSAVDSTRRSEIGHRRGPEASDTVFITLLTPEE